MAANSEQNKNLCPQVKTARTNNKDTSVEIILGSRWQINRKKHFLKHSLLYSSRRTTISHYKHWWLPPALPLVIIPVNPLYSGFPFWVCGHVCLEECAEHMIG